MKDASYFMKWDKFLKVAEHAGFKKLLLQEFDDERGHKTHNYVGVRSSLLLHATSVQNDKILQLDGGVVCGAMKVLNKQWLRGVCERNNLTCGSTTESDVVFFFFDVRGGFLRRLKDFKESNVELVSWPKQYPEPNVLDNLDRDSQSQHAKDNFTLWCEIKSKLSFVP